MNEASSKKVQQRTLEGSVVSTSMDKTLVVRVERTKLHPKYDKRYITTKKFLVHDPKNSHKVGDKVRFVASRPISKRKRWIVVEEKSA